MLKMLFETGHPWLTFKDPCNVRTPQDHAGVIHSSNLCTEITLNTGPDETAVCNLGSIVLDQHLLADGALDHAKLRETIRIAVRALDDVIDINFYPDRAGRDRERPPPPDRARRDGAAVRALPARAPRSLREAGVEFSDEVMEAVAYYAYEASSDLAAERGTYASYPGSKWDRGLLPQDTVDLLEAERGEAVEVARGGRLDWAPLRAKIAAQGMRNSNVLAIAPTATIANIMGTSPCIEPTYKNLFAKSNLSGDFIVLNPFLVRDLKAAGLWNAGMAEQLKAVEGDVSRDRAVSPPSCASATARPSRSSPTWLIDAAARRQKWIDQSQSLNLFLAAPDMKAMSHMYRRAWRAGLKTTYYLRTLGASTIEKATVAAGHLLDRGDAQRRGVRGLPVSRCPRSDSADGRGGSGADRLVGMPRRPALAVLTALLFVVPASVRRPTRRSPSTPRCSPGARPCSRSPRGTSSRSRRVPRRNGSRST